MTLRCDGCTSFETAPNGSGLCHFLPPSQYRDVRNEIWSPFPLVQPDWWCSQHEARPPCSQDREHESEHEPNTSRTLSELPALEDEF